MRSTSRFPPACLDRNLPAAPGIVPAIHPGDGVVQGGTPHGACTLVYGGRGPKLEVTVQQGAAQVGKFFLSEQTPRRERFRIAGKDSVSLQFTAAPDRTAAMD